MTVKELIAQLRRLPGDSPVFLAVQPSYPFKCEIDGVTVWEGGEDDGDCEEEDGSVFILQGEQIDYTTGSLWE